MDTSHPHSVNFLKNYLTSKVTLFLSPTTVQDPAKRTHRKIYPAKPYQRVRQWYITKVKAAYTECCRNSPPKHCGGYFEVRNHHCNAELFDNSLKDQVVINDATDSVAFLAVFDDIVAEKPQVVYVSPVKVRNLTY